MFMIISRAIQTFLKLTDTPASYTGEAGKVARVNAGETALEFAEISAAKIHDADNDTSVDTEEAADADTIVGKVAGVEALRFHTSGIMDLAKQSRVRAHLSIRQTIANGVWTVVEHDTEDVDAQNEWSTVTYRFTAKEAGSYLVSAANYYLALADQNICNVAIYVNGVLQSLSRFTVSGTNSVEPFTGDVIVLNANDYIEIKGYHSYGSDREIDQPYSFVSICKVA